MQQTESYTVDEVKSRVLNKAVVILVSSKKVEDGADNNGKPRFKAIPTGVTVACEADMKPELVMWGPKQRGEVNVYAGTDGRKHYFDAETGAALGSQLRSKEQIRNFMKPILPSKFDPPPRGKDRRYLS